MSMSTIINSLSSGQLITPIQLDSLKHCADKKSFISTLVNVYEDNVRSYTEACLLFVKPALSSTEGNLGAEKVLDVALATFLGNDKFSFVPSTKMLLKENDSDLLTLLGLTAPNDSSPELKNLVVKNLTSLIARYCLIRAVDILELQALCQEVEAENPLLFPPYLLNALLIECKCSYIVKNHLENQGNNKNAFYISEQVAKDQNILLVGVCNIIYYLGKLIQKENLSPSTMDRHFRHLRSDATFGTFVQQMGSTIIAEMSLEQKQKDIERRNNDYLSSKISKTCSPALSFLGLSISMDLSHIDALALEIKSAIKATEKAKNETNASIDKNLEQGREAIQKWRNSVQLPEVVWGVKYSFQK